jgi:hypothetical protein
MCTFLLLWLLPFEIFAADLQELVSASEGNSGRFEESALRCILEAFNERQKKSRGRHARGGEAEHQKAIRLALCPTKPTLLRS